MQKTEKQWTKKLTRINLAMAIATLIIVLLVPFTSYLQINDGIVANDIVHVYRNGILVQTVYNAMTVNGKPRLNDRLFNSSWTVAVWNYIAIGTGTDDGNNTNNDALITELSRNLATFWRPAATQWGLNATFTFGGSYTIKEAGTFNAASNGNLLFYVGTLSVAVTSSDTLTISWTGTTSGTTT